MRGLIQTPNTVVQNSTTIPVTAPAISATAGSGGSTITLSDSDTNHRLTIFYTTDGSTPAIFRPGSTAGTSKVYTAPFAVPTGTTVKAIASWGQGANQGIVFPSFGYVPSSVTALGVTANRRKDADECVSACYCEYDGDGEYAAIHRLRRLFGWLGE